MMVTARSKVPKTTIIDIAAASGVSVATVSRILNDKPDVADATRKRVLRVMDEIGFAPQSAWRQIRSGRTGLIAVYARGTGQIIGGGQNARAQIHLHESKLFPGSPRILEFSSAQPQLRVTTPGTGDVDGASSLARGGWLVFPASPGRYEFELRYSVAGGGQAIFQNTGIWAGVIG